MLLGSEASLFSFSLWSTKISLWKEFSYVFSSYRPYVSPFVPPPLSNVLKPFSQILEQCPLLSTFWTHPTISFKICKLANPKHSTASTFQSTIGTKLQFFVVKPPLNSSNSLGLGRLAHFEFCGISLRSIICSDRCGFWAWNLQSQRRTRYPLDQPCIAAPKRTRYLYLLSNLFSSWQ